MKVSKIPAALTALLLATVGVMTTISLAQADGSPLTDATCVPAVAYTVVDTPAWTEIIPATPDSWTNEAWHNYTGNFDGVGAPLLTDPNWGAPSAEPNGQHAFKDHTPNVPYQTNDTGNGNWFLWTADFVTGTQEKTIVHPAVTHVVPAVVCPEPIPAPAPEKKVFVCKYVGTPGVDERLQTGDNPISVSVNAIEHNQWDGIVPGWFSDAQDRSYVLSYDTGQVKPGVSECLTLIPTPEQTVTPTPEAAVTPTSPATKSEVLAAEPNVTPTPTRQVAAVPAGALSTGDGSTAALASTGANPLPWSLAALLLIASGSLLLPKVRRVVFRH